MEKPVNFPQDDKVVYLYRDGRPAEPPIHYLNSSTMVNRYKARDTLRMESRPLSNASHNRYVDDIKGGEPPRRRLPVEQSPREELILPSIERSDPEGPLLSPTRAVDALSLRNNPILKERDEYLRTPDPYGHRPALRDVNLHPSKRRTTLDYPSQNFAQTQKPYEALDQRRVMSPFPDRRPVDNSVPRLGPQHEDRQDRMRMPISHALPGSYRPVHDQSFMSSQSEIAPSQSHYLHPLPSDDPFSSPTSIFRRDRPPPQFERLLYARHPEAGVEQFDRATSSTLRPVQSDLFHLLPRQEIVERTRLDHQVSSSDVRDTDLRYQNVGNGPHSKVPPRHHKALSSQQLIRHDDPLHPYAHENGPPRIHELNAQHGASRYVTDGTSIRHSQLNDRSEGRPQVIVDHRGMELQHGVIPRSSALPKPRADHLDPQRGPHDIPSQARTAEERQSERYGIHYASNLKIPLSI